MDLEITKNRTFKGVTFRLEDGEALPLDNVELFMIISMGDGFDPDLQLSSSATDGSRLIKRGSEVEIYITSEDTAELYNGLEYEVGAKVGNDTETLFVGNVLVKEGRKV